MQILQRQFTSAIACCVRWYAFNDICKYVTPLKDRIFIKGTKLYFCTKELYDILVCQ